VLRLRFQQDVEHGASPVVGREDDFAGDDTTPLLALRDGPISVGEPRDEESLNGA